MHYSIRFTREKATQYQTSMTWGDLTNYAVHNDMMGLNECINSSKSEIVSRILKATEARQLRGDSVTRQ